jgi:UDP-glucose 4-epimerase
MTEDIKLVCTKKRKTVSDENSIQKRRRHTKNENSVFSQIENGMKSVVKSEAVLLQELEKQLFKEINDMSNALTESQRHLSELRMESDELANRISKKKYLPQNEPKLVFDSVEFERMFEHVNHPSKYFDNN